MRVDLGFRTEIAHTVTALENRLAIIPHQHGEPGRTRRSHSRENRIDLLGR